MQPSFVKVLLYLFVKYVVFFFVLAILNDRFKSLVIDNSENGKDILMNSLSYAGYLIIFTLFLILIFAAPIYFLFQVKSIIVFVSFVLVVSTVEYFLYTYFASQTELMNGIYLEIISLLLLFLFFNKAIKLLFSKNKTTSYREDQFEFAVAYLVIERIDPGSVDFDQNVSVSHDRLR